MADVGRRPTGADDVLVEALAGAQPQGEAAFAHHRHGGCRLGDDRRVVADDGAGDHGGQLHPLGGVGHRSQHRPCEGAVVLAREPGVVVVGEHGELEASLLGQPGVADERAGVVALAHEGVAEAGHGRRPAHAGAGLHRSLSSSLP